MDTRTAAPDPEMPRGEADGADGSELPGDDNREFKTFKGQGFDPGHVVGPKKGAELRAGLIRAAQALPKGAERTALLAVVNGEDPGGEIQTRRAAELTLREDVIRLAHSMPKGSDERRRLMGALVEAKAKGKVPEEFKEYQGEKNPKKPGSDADGDGKTNEPSPVPEKGESDKKAAPKTSRLMKRQEKVLEAFLTKWSRRTSAQVTSYDDLPHQVRTALERIKDGESLWSDVERWLGDNQPNPHMRAAADAKPLKGKKAALVRLAATLPTGSDERKAILLLADGCDKLPEGPMRDNCKGGPPGAKKDDKGKGDDKGKKKDDGKMPAELLEKFEKKEKKKKAKIKEDSECMKKYQDADGSFKGGKGAAFKNCVKGFEECATGVTDAAGLCATIGREHGKMASASVKDAGTAAFKAARAMGESPEVALLAARVAMEIRRG